MCELLLALMIYVAQATGLPTGVCPDMETMTEAEMFETATGVAWEDQEVSILALYKDQTIYVREDFSVAGIQDLGLLIHELVHYQQDLAGMRGHVCVGEQERQAYAVHHAFLRSANAEPEIGPLLLALITQCERTF